MIETQFASILVNVALIIMVLLMIPTSWRVYRGPSPADRLQAVELLTTQLVGIIVLLALVEGTEIVIDMAIALAAFSFVGTFAIARYISEGRVF